MGIAFMAFLAYSLALSESGIAGAIPVLGALALGAQRLLPVLQQGYASWSSIVGSQSSLADALDLLEQQMPDVSVHTANHALAFNRQIELKDVSFRYRDDAPWVLHDINLVIKKGSRVGFVGTTGSGKSTLLDIVMGLLYPTQGCMLVDGQVVDVNNMRGWQQHIAHVPQSIYLSDASVAENIAFGIPKDNIDYARVKVAAEQAQIADVIEGLAKDYNTLVGERGVRLSGGQRQRIGIARALYKQASVIIFDEATSALDNETEQAVMESIEKLSKELTVLIIAHRLSTLEKCDIVIRLNKGFLVENAKKISN
jgi:ATP-binding cassette subfamily B protein